MSSFEESIRVHGLIKWDCFFSSIEEFRDWWRCHGSHKCHFCAYYICNTETVSNKPLCPLRSQEQPGQCNPAWESLNKMYDASCNKKVVDLEEVNRQVYNMYELIHDCEMPLLNNRDVNLKNMNAKTLPVGTKE